MGVWQAIELLNTLVDDSDPDVCFRSCFTTRFWLMRFMFIDKCVSNRTSFTDRGGHTSGWQARVDAGEFIDITASAQILSRTPILASVPFILAFHFHSPFLSSQSPSHRSPNTRKHKDCAILCSSHARPAEENQNQNQNTQSGSEIRYPF